MCLIPRQTGVFQTRGACSKSESVSPDTKHRFPRLTGVPILMVPSDGSTPFRGSLQSLTSNGYSYRTGLPVGPVRVSDEVGKHRLWVTYPQPNLVY